MGAKSLDTKKNSHINDFVCVLFCIFIVCSNECVCYLDHIFRSFVHLFICLCFFVVCWCELHVREKEREIALECGKYLIKFR